MGLWYEFRYISGIFWEVGLYVGRFIWDKIGRCGVKDLVLRNKFSFVKVEN